MGNRITISGGIVADPEDIAGGKGLKFPLYDNETKKSQDTGDYEKTGNVTKLQVVLWGETADQWRGQISKGDIVEIKGTIVEKEFDKRDGTKGRQLETSFVNEVRIVHKGSGNNSGVDQWDQSATFADDDTPF